MHLQQRSSTRITLHPRRYLVYSSPKCKPQPQNNLLDGRERVFLKNSNKQSATHQLRFQPPIGTTYLTCSKWRFGWSY